jgi:hypothetical protein
VLLLAPTKPCDFFFEAITRIGDFLPIVFGLVDNAFRSAGAKCENYEGPQEQHGAPIAQIEREKILHWCGLTIVTDRISLGTKV